MELNLVKFLYFISLSFNLTYKKIDYDSGKTTLLLVKADAHI